MSKLLRNARRVAVLTVVALMACVGVVLASEGGSSVTICVPAKEGKPIVTPKGGVCKTGYALTEVSKEGPEGKPGKEGPEGKPGKEGAPGPFPATLPHGASLTGTYAVVGGASSGTGSDWGTSEISFSYHLASAPTAVFVRKGGPAMPGCNGSAAAPTAESGTLCVYEGNSSNVNLEVGPQLCTPTACGFGNFASSVGAVVRFFGTGTARWYDWGTWAVTG